MNTSLSFTIHPPPHLLLPIDANWRAVAARISLAAAAAAHAADAKAGSVQSTSADAAGPWGV